MSETGKLVVSIELDTTELMSQLSQLGCLLKSFECIPDNLVSALNSHLPAVLNDIVFADGSAAIGAGFNIVHRVRLGTKYERFTAAIRAGKLDTNFL
ncbi:hypothetical protein [Erwinia sp. Leaf53]|uniref:hypothetical protein n=1 Tax=Erwinia sp. Leaf53 TaxID=1736225 RepID=UPI000A69E3B4|nr:hypothetical protein [Erwinia sp. Leaf53]